MVCSHAGSCCHRGHNHIHNIQAQQISCHNNHHSRNLHNVHEDPVGFCECSLQHDHIHIQVQQISCHNIHHTHNHHSVHEDPEDSCVCSCCLHKDGRQHLHSQ